MTTAGRITAPAVVPAMTPFRTGSTGSAVAADANLVLRFLVELGAYASLAYGGASVPGPTALRIVAAVVAPLIAGVVWWLALAPKAPRPLGEPAAVVLESVVFGSAVTALALSGAPIAGLVFGAVAVANTVLVRLLDGGRRPKTDGQPPLAHTANEKGPR